MPRIQLIVEAESARHLASVINQLAWAQRDFHEGRPKSPEDEKPEAPTQGTSLPHPPTTSQSDLNVGTTIAKGNGADTPPAAAPELPRPEDSPPVAPAEAPPLPSAGAAARTKKAKKPEPEPEPSEPPKSKYPPLEEAPIPELPADMPTLDELKSAITKAVVSDPPGGPVRTALETLKPLIKVQLIRNCVEAHRPALWAFVQKHDIPLPDQV